MRKLLSLLCLIMLFSCQDAGTTSKRLNGDEESLPPELKGLKVYNLSIGKGDYVKVGLLDNKVNSMT